jgi:tRNA modification GTPase
VIDTAGLRESDDEVEKVGISHAWDAIKTADVVLFLHDLTRSGSVAYSADDAAIAGLLTEKLPSRTPIIDIWNKVDAASTSGHRPGLSLSAKTGHGLDALRCELLALAGWQSAPEGVYISRQRHLQALQRVQDHLVDAHTHLHDQAGSLDLLAEELRLAQNALSEITGEFTSDDLLGTIFSKFCIGK